jgi:hypothetical protein
MVFNQPCNEFIFSLHCGFVQTGQDLKHLSKLTKLFILYMNIIYIHIGKKKGDGGGGGGGDGLNI